MLIFRMQLAVVIVAAMNAFLAGLLILLPVVATEVLHRSAPDAAWATQVALGALDVVLGVVGLFVCAVSAVRTAETAVAAQVRVLALLRLIGADAGRLRTYVDRRGTVSAFVGALVGTALSVPGMIGLIAIASALGVIPFGGYVAGTPLLVLPVVTVTLTAAIATSRGTRSMFSITPLQALSAEDDRPNLVLNDRRQRSRVWALVILGGVVIVASTAAGAAVGAFHIGVLQVLLLLPLTCGSLLIFSGFLAGLNGVVTRMLRLLVRFFRPMSVAALAADHALRTSRRQARSIAGVCVGSTLFVTISVALGTVEALPSHNHASHQLDVNLRSIVDVVLLLIALTASTTVGGVLALNARVRQRELGLLRILGLNLRRLRWVLLTEAALLAGSAGICSLALGTVFGWATAQTILGSAGQLLVPVLPAPEGLLLLITFMLVVALSALPPLRALHHQSPITAVSSGG